MTQETQDDLRAIGLGLAVIFSVAGLLFGIYALLWNITGDPVAAVKWFAWGAVSVVGFVLALGFLIIVSGWIGYSIQDHRKRNV